MVDAQLRYFLSEEFTTNLQREVHALIFGDIGTRIIFQHNVG